jgi:hypothetical protein
MNNMCIEQVINGCSGGFNSRTSSHEFRVIARVAVFATHVFPASQQPSEQQHLSSSLNSRSDASPSRASNHGFTLYITVCP